MGNQETRIISNDEELKIFSDPYRLKIIETYKINNVPMTLKQCADQMGEPPAKVFYHIKKLVKINILELDHTESINGIIAKYYKLTADRFVIRLEGEHSNLYNHVDQVTNLLFRQIDEFKNDIAERSKQYTPEYLEKHPEQKTEQGDGIFSKRDIFLSDEEYHEINEFIANFVDNHSTKADNKKRYSFLAGLITKATKE